MKRILSGIRATGDAQLGNYIGAIQNWVNLQHQADEVLLFIADLHSVNAPIDDNKTLREKSLEMAAALLACGIDPQKTSLFCQSQVSAHAELSWIFSCMTSLGWLNRMTQFKDKAGKNTDHADLGLYAYPVLMAADILIYKASHVPVGEDQKQHVELARDIVNAFNHRYKTDYFSLPEPLIIKEGARIMSLRDGTSKMSKSDISDYSRINLTDDDDLIVKKIQKAKSDAFPLPSTIQELEGRPEAKNLLTILAVMQNKSLESMCESMGGQNYSTLKKELAACLVEHLSPIREKIKYYLKDGQSELIKIMDQGSEKARALASKHLREVYDCVGLY
jgi:tryptophanyl-tRNA synthetase